MKQFLPGITYRLINFRQLLFVFILIYSESQAQLYVSNFKELQDLQKYPTYAIMKDLDSDLAKEYMNVLEEQWTYNKIRFITAGDLLHYLSPNATYLSITYEIRSNAPVGFYSKGGGLMYLELWSCNSKFIDKLKSHKVVSFFDRTTYARVSMDVVSDTNINFIFNQLDLPYGKGGNIANWSPGYLKNYIQIITGFINSQETIQYYHVEQKKKELTKLRKDTLFIDEHVLQINARNTKKPEGLHDPKELLRDYGFSYKLLEGTSLSTKILDAQRVFFYLLPSYGKNFFHLMIVNAVTGEIVYAMSKGSTASVSSKEFRKIAQSIP